MHILLKIKEPVVTHFFDSYGPCVVGSTFAAFKMKYGTPKMNEFSSFFLAFLFYLKTSITNT